ncbi:MAG TPA: hypothetical protein DCW52_08725 [Gammaproteobacteria bacterium]|jgi:hypothetical protein|nr:hypothetical protein [Gammaproteobacteria bacterium]
MRYSVALLYTLSTLLAALIPSTFAQAQSNNRVVVIPLGSDPVDENFLPVAIGSVNEGGFNGVGMTLIKPLTGTYVFTVGSVIGDEPVVLLTNAAASLSPRKIGYALSGSNITVYVFD